MGAPVPQPPAPRAAGGAARRVLMVTSPGVEPSLQDVATNLATVCAETGQRVAIVSTAGLSSPQESAPMESPAPLWWRSWPGSPGDGVTSPEDERARLLSGPLHPADMESLLGVTGVPGVSRLDLRYFVGHPAQVVVRMPDVLAALRDVVDVVILEVPLFTSVHHGEGLAPLADVVLVVGERETTTVEQVRRTSATLQKLGAPVVGMALTGGAAQHDLWGADSELEEGDEIEEGEEMETEPGSASGSEPEDGPEPSDEHDVTAPLPIIGLAREAPAARADNGSNGSAVTHARSEA